MDWLLRQLAERLGVTPAGVGESFQPRIDFEQPLGQGITLLIVVGSLALIAWLYRRENPARPFTKIVLAGLRFSLVDPDAAADQRSRPDDRADRSTVLRRDDRRLRQSGAGGSVRRPATAKEATAQLAKLSGRPQADRLAVAEGLLAKDNGALLRELQKKHRVRLYRVSNTARPLAAIDRPEQVADALKQLRKIEPTGDQSRLGAGIRQVLTELRGFAPTAILLLSDGQVTDGETVSKAAEFAGRKDVPLFTVGLGSSDAPRDIDLSELLVDDVVFVDDLIRFQPKLTTQGFAGQELTVRLKQRTSPPGAPETTRELATTRVRGPQDGQSTRIELQHRPKETGPVTFIVEVDPQERERKV